MTTPPPPGGLPAVARPPCARAIASTSASPRPAAPRARPTSARVKRSNACGRNAAGKPAPSSATLRTTPAVVLSGHEAHSPRAVPKRVVDEIAECLFQPQPVAGDRETGGRVDLDLAARGGEPPCDRFEQLAGADRLPAQPKLSLVRTREDEQILGKPYEPVGLLGRRGERGVLLLGAARPAERELELRLQQRERSPELVACLGDEAALALEPGFEPCEHRPQRGGRERVARKRGEEQHEAGRRAGAASAARRVRHAGRPARRRRRRPAGPPASRGDARFRARPRSSRAARDRARPAVSSGDVPSPRVASCTSPPGPSTCAKLSSLSASREPPSGEPARTSAATSSARVRSAESICSSSAEPSRT